MENSVRSSENLENPRKTRSLDLQSLYVEKGEGSGLKRKTSSSLSEEFGLGQSIKKKKKKKKKKSRKEVSHSSFESEFIKKSEKRPNVVDGLELNENVSKNTNDHVSGDGNLKSLSSLSNISSSFDANPVPIPKRPRCFMRRKKLLNNHLWTQDGASEEISSDAQSAKLTGQSVSPSLSSESRRKNVNDDFKENSFNRTNSAHSARARDSVSVSSPSKTVRRDHDKRREIRPQHTGVDRRKLSDNNPNENLQDDDEQNLEENAARMLSSRFDPSCTVFSGNGTASASHPVNGLSAGSSIHKDLLCFQSNHSPGSDDNGTDAAGRLLRPRRNGKKNRLTRKRRHFYEIFSREVDVYWVVNRRIKVYWPLDKSWYFGLVTSYDQHRKLHHVSYDDRDEEWINLQTERFKLLLLPNEAPRKHFRKSGVDARSVAEQKEDVELQNDDDISGCKDSEPIISWLTQSTRRVKSQHLGAMKRRKLQSESKNVTVSLMSEESASTFMGSLVSGHFRADANVSSSDSGVPPDDKEISEASCSHEKRLRFVYSRKRLRQGGQGLHCTSDNSECKSIVVYAPHVFCSGRLGHLEECNIARQCFGVDDLDPGCLSWSGVNLGLLKLIISPMNLRQVILKVSLQLQFSVHAFEVEDLWICRTLLLLQHGIVRVMWPKVQLEMLFVDNVVGLRFLLFEGCLMQAVAFVCLVLEAFHQPNECEELLDQQIPVTSIRFEISGFPNFRRRFIFVLYNFVEVRNSKWRYLDKKLKHYCSVTKQLPLSECTYDNIKILQNRCSLVPSPSVCQEPISFEGSQKRSRPAIMHKRVSKESAYVNMGLLSSSWKEKPKRVPHFLLPFAAAPSFFLGLHLKLLMAKNVASIIFCNPLLLLEDSENSSRLVADDDHQAEEIPDQIIPDNSTNSNLTRTGTQCELLCSPELEVDTDDLSMCNEGNCAISLQKSQDSKSDIAQTSVSNLFALEHCAASSCPPVGEELSSEEKPKTEFLSHLNGIKVQIPTFDQVETQSCDGVMQDTQLSTPDSVWSVNDCAIRSPNPTGPRSIWHRSRHSSGSMSFGYRSKMWPDGRVDSPHNNVVNGSKKPRSQNSYLLPFGNYDFSSKPRSHHRKGRPFKRIKTDSGKTATNGSGSPQSDMESLSCDANVLITVGDRGWRECGAHVLLECIDTNEWRLLVNISGLTKYSYKAYQFLQPGTTNRYTHAMMWKGGKDWILEFPDRSQWILFKEMHEECYNRNLRAASVKSIPIPGVRLIEDNDDNGVEVPFVRISPKYFMQLETDVDMALNPSRILYDMDSDDEDWILKRRTSCDATVSNLMEISEEMFERTIDLFEKLAYTQQREDFTGEEIEELMVGGQFDLIKDIYEYWKQKRQMKGMPLIRHLQSPLWERYQQQLKEWELAVNKIHHFPNGCKEKAMLLEKPAMFAFCLRPRGLEVPNKGSKQRSQRKVSAGGQSCGVSRDSEGQHVLGRKSNGFVCGDERLPAGSNHEYASSWQVSTKAISPRDTVSTGYLSMSSDGSEISHSRRLHRNKSRKIGTLITPNDSQMIVKPYNQRLGDKRNVVSRWNVGLPEWSSQNQYQRERLQRPRVEKLGGPDLDEFRLRDASSAAQHASNMAKLKREKAQRLLYRADLAIHKAMVALMTAEAIKASSEDSAEDG